MVDSDKIGLIDSVKNDTKDFFCLVMTAGESLGVTDKDKAAQLGRRDVGGGQEVCRTINGRRADKCSKY